MFWIAPRDVGPADRERYFEMLDAPEQRRIARIRSETQRDADVVARALARTALSLFAPVAPAAWRFVLGPRGKPYVHPDHGVPLFFNITHTTDLVACVVADREVGIDAEHFGRRGRIDALARRFFSASESALVASAPEDGRVATFLAVWTLKEAYLKARGLGLALRLSAFSFTLDPPRVTFEPELEDAPDRWQLFQTHPTESHVLAVAIARRDGDVAVRSRRLQP